MTIHIRKRVLIFNVFLICIIICTRLDCIANGQSCPFFGDVKRKEEAHKGNEGIGLAQAAHRVLLQSDESSSDTANEDDDKLKAVNDHLFSFHNRERGRRLTNALKTGVLSTCEGKMSLCFLGKEPDGETRQFPYLPWWDCTSHSMPSTTDRYTTTKEMSHIALSTYLLLNPVADGISPDGETHGRIVEYLNALKEAQHMQVNETTFPSCPSDFPWSKNCWPGVDLLQNEQEIMNLATSMLDTAARGDPVQRTHLNAFAANTKDLLVNNLNVAVRDRVRKTRAFCPKKYERVLVLYTLHNRNSCIYIFTT